MFKILDALSAGLRSLGSLLGISALGDLARTLEKPAQKTRMIKDEVAMKKHHASSAAGHFKRAGQKDEKDQQQNQKQNKVA